MNSEGEKINELKLGLRFKGNIWICDQEIDYLLDFPAKGPFSPGLLMSSTTSAWAFCLHVTDLGSPLPWETWRHTNILSLYMCMYWGARQGVSADCGHIPLEKASESLSEDTNSLKICSPHLSCTPVRITVPWDKQWKTLGVGFYPAPGSTPLNLCWCFWSNVSKHTIFNSRARESPACKQ